MNILDRIWLQFSVQCLSRRMVLILLVEIQRFGNTKELWSYSGGLWWPNTLLRRIILVFFVHCLCTYNLFLGLSLLLSLYSSLSHMNTHASTQTSPRRTIMVHIAGWMLVVNQTTTPAENSIVILASCHGSDIVFRVWLTEIKGLLYVPSTQQEMMAASPPPRTKYSG